MAFYNGELDGTSCKFFGAFAKIYTLSSLSGEIFYVGCTVRSLEMRLNCHISEAKKGDTRKCSKIRELDFKVRISAVDIEWVTGRKSYSALAKAYHLERKWIQTLLSEGHKLLNRQSQTIKQPIIELNEYRMWLSKKETGLTDSEILEEEKVQA